MLGDNISLFGELKSLYQAVCNLSHTEDSNEGVKSGPDAEHGGARHHNQAVQHLHDLGQGIVLESLLDQSRQQIRTSCGAAGQKHQAGSHAAYDSPE